MPRFRRARITIDAVDRLRPGEILMDIEEPGFGVRIQQKRVVFFVRKFARNRRHFVTLGEVGTGGLTVTSARDLAKRHVADMRQGGAPADLRAKMKAMPTVAEFAAQWLATHVDVKLKTSTASIYRSTLKTIVLPVIGGIRISDLEEDHVETMHRKARATPYAANRALAIISNMMNAAERKKLRAPNSNPVKGLARYREEKRERFLNRAELRRIGAALSDPAVRARHSIYALAAIAFLLLTGMRLNEVLRLRWSEIDFERGLLLLADSKTGKKPVLLTEPALRLIVELPRSDEKWVFPGGKAGKPLNNIKKAWATVTAAAGLEGVRLHDLRHTYASVTAGHGASLPMIGRLLGHSQPATTQRYAHLAADPLREIAERATGAIADALGRKSHQLLTGSGDA